MNNQTSKPHEAFCLDNEATIEACERCAYVGMAAEVADLKAELNAMKPVVMAAIEDSQSSAHDNDCDCAVCKAVRCFLGSTTMVSDPNLNEIEIARLRARVAELEAEREAIVQAAANGIDEALREGMKELVAEHVKIVAERDALRERISTECDILAEEFESDDIDWGEKLKCAMKTLDAIRVAVEE